MQFNMFVNAENTDKLQKAEIAGKEFYVYEVKKDESIYGIAKKFGWDKDELLKMNPNSTGILSKGTKIYYPTGIESNTKEEINDLQPKIDRDKEVVSTSTGKETLHKVKKGETIYSIAHQYDVPLAIIYKNNPWVTKGIKAGDEIVIGQSSSFNDIVKSKNNHTISNISITNNEKQSEIDLNRTEEVAEIILENDSIEEGNNFD